MLVCKWLFSTQPEFRWALGVVKGAPCGAVSHALHDTIIFIAKAFKRGYPIHVAGPNGLGAPRNNDGTKPNGF